MLPGDGLSFQILRTKSDAKKPGGERLAYTYPPSSFTSVPDLQIQLLRPGMALETLTKSYNEALASVTPEAHLFFGLLRPPTLLLPA